MDKHAELINQVRRHLTRYQGGNNSEEQLRELANSLKDMFYIIRDEVGVSDEYKNYRGED